MQRSAGSYFRKSPPPSQKSNNWHFSHVEKPGEVQGEWQTRNFTKSGHSFYLLRAVTWVEVQCGEQVRENLRKKKRKEKESRKVRWRRWVPSNGLHLEKKREAGLRLIRFHTPLSLSWGFSNKWGSGHDRQGKAVAMHSSDMTKLEYWLRSCGAGLIDGWFSWWWMFRQLFTAATLVT